MTSQPTPGEVLNGESLDDAARRLFAVQYPGRDYDNIGTQAKIVWLRSAHKDILSRISRPQPSGGQDEGGAWDSSPFLCGHCHDTVGDCACCGGSEILSLLTDYDHCSGYDGKDWENVSAQAAQRIRLLMSERQALHDAFEALASPAKATGWPSREAIYALVCKIGRLPHPADDDYSYPADDDAERDTLNGLIADAREIMSLAAPALKMKGRRDG